MSIVYSYQPVPTCLLAVLSAVGGAPLRKICIPRRVGIEPVQGCVPLRLLHYLPLKLRCQPPRLLLPGCLSLHTNRTQELWQDPLRPARLFLAIRGAPFSASYHPYHSRCINEPAGRRPRALLDTDGALLGLQIASSCMTNDMASCRL